MFIGRQSAYVSLTVLIVLLLAVISLQLLHHLSSSKEAPPRRAAEQPNHPPDRTSTSSSSQLFAPIRRMQAPELVPPPAAQPKPAEITPPLSRFAPVKQRKNRSQTGSDFIKISFEGDVLAAQAPRWSCVRDLGSGLMWEVKLSDAGISDVDHTYSWYQSRRMYAGRENGGRCFGIRCDTEAYIEEINRLALCGSAAWRLPSLKELDGLIDRHYYNPTINQAFFPNTRGTVYWTDTELENNSEMVMQIDFFNGMSTAVPKKLSYYLRLVSP